MHVTGTGWTNGEWLLTEVTGCGPRPDQVELSHLQKRKPPTGVGHVCPGVTVQRASGMSSPRSVAEEVAVIRTFAS